MSIAHEQKSLAASVVGAVVLFAAVVAGIMAIGWGLMKLAENSRPAAPTGVQDGKVVLNIYEALIRGDSTLARSRKAPSPYIDRWKNTEDTVEWRFHVPRAGKYTLEVTYTCDAQNAGGDYEAIVSGSVIGAWFGRVEGTVDEKTLRTDNLGVVSFDAPGWHLLTFKPTRVPGDNLMRLSGVAFVPVR